MALKLNKPTTPSRRFSSRLDNSGLTSAPAFKRLSRILPKKSGRNSTGQVTVRHQGARKKRFLREIDWLRDKRNMNAIVERVEYDPNRTANVALVRYQDGERRYILAPDGMMQGQEVRNGDSAPLKAGNALPLKGIPVGTLIHAVEVKPGKGAQIGRGAGTAVTIVGFEEAWALLKLPSGEIRRFYPEAYAAIGQVSNPDWKNIVLGSAGRKRRMGIRPTVRGTAQNPRSHPHGGGEGRSGEGMHPKTPWGKSARGTHTRNKRKHSGKLIVSRRK